MICVCLKGIHLKKYGTFLPVFMMLFVASIHGKEPLQVIYPNINGLGEKSFGYEVLKLALENSGTNYRLEMNNRTSTNERIRILIKNKKISIADFGTNEAYENDLLPIYFPIDLGLNGWRIFLIHQENQAAFNNIKTLKDLRQKIAGQGRGWADTEILRNARLSVVESKNVENIIKMLGAKRFDYFPLGVNEAHFLLNEYAPSNPNIIVEPKLLLIYPFARLFFVHKDNQELHDLVESGLLTSFENGSFWALFKSHASNKALFTEVKLQQRTKILIDNPNLSKKFNKIPKEYFFNLDWLK